MNPAKMLYKLPQGTERLLLDEAFRRQSLLQKVQNLFTSWGYLPVQTPVFDFYDLYAPFLGQAAENVYRLIDREGDLLMLRSDITLFLARSMGVALREGHAPLRVCYGDTILRHQDVEDISANEFYQIGAEFIGSSSPEGDLEILLLAEEFLHLFGLENARIHLGSRAVFQAAFGDKDDNLKNQLLQTILLRRTAQMKTLLGSDPRADELCRLFSFLGSSAEARKLLDSLKGLAKFDPSVLQTASKLLELSENLETLGMGNRFRLDFSEVGKNSYYTGLVFQVYQEGIGDAIGGGGRYDGLLKKFGLDSPSVGFSYHLGKLEHLVEFSDLTSPSRAEKAQGSSLMERWASARTARRNGRIVTLS